MNRYKAGFGCLYVLILLVGGWVLQVMWGWFVVPIFDLRPLTIAEAIGISLVVSCLTYHNTTTKSESADYDGLGEKMFKATLTALGYPILTLVVGWVVHLFM